MTAITFDTLAYVRKLEAAGVPRPQAEAQADAFAAAISEGVASKQDIAELRGEVREFRADVDHKLRELEQRLVIKPSAMIGAGIAFLSMMKVFGH